MYILFYLFLNIIIYIYIKYGLSCLSVLIKIISSHGTNKSFDYSKFYFHQLLREHLYSTYKLFGKVNYDLLVFLSSCMYARFDIFSSYLKQSSRNVQTQASIHKMRITKFFEFSAVYEFFIVEL